MELVTGAMGSLVPKLGLLLKEEYQLQTGVRKQVEALTRELEMMHAALRKVAEVPPEQLDELVKLWARDVRELSYDIDDILDDFLLRVGDDGTLDAKAKKQSLTERFTKMMGKMGELFTKAKARHQIASAVEEINKQLRQVSDRRGRYTTADIVARPVTASTIDPRIFALYKDVAQLVGIKGPREEMIRMLSEGDDAPKRTTKVVSIVGVGGLGKTTLAKAVYDKLKEGFDCCAFVPVGLNPSRTKVLKDLLIDLGTTILHLTELDERQLIKELREFLEEKRYFVVIDDIWDKESWTIIRCALVDNSYGSKIVATTRKYNVATNIGIVYELEPLSHKNSVKLLHTRIGVCEEEWSPFNILYAAGASLAAFPSKKKEWSPNQSTNALYDMFYHKCGGVPLAIITIASLLANKPREVWTEVYDSIGFGNGGNDDAENTRRILSYSYYDLPCHLRTCLVYLSMFPEDFLICKYRLIWMWIAEGFIHKEEGGGLFEAGERCLNELINRSMVQPHEDKNSVLVGCRVHDMVLDLVRSFSCEENFITILDKEPSTVTFQHRKLVHNRRVTIHRNSINLDSDPHGKVGSQHVRSIAAFGCEGSTLVSTSFRGLRVLHMEDCPFTRGSGGLAHLGVLLHLRYLGLVHTNICKLPKEIGNLKLLQTLELTRTYVEELSSSVGVLTQLLCLRVDNNLRTVSRWIGNLTSLQELNISWNDNDNMLTTRIIKELGKLSDLRVLSAKFRIKLSGRLERDFVGTLLLGNLDKIRHIKIIWPGGFVHHARGFRHHAIRLGAAPASVVPTRYHLRHLELEFMWFHTMPEWINPSILPCLSHLQVYVQVVQEKDMKALGRMRELRFLSIYSCRNAFICWMTDAASTEQDSYFKKLRVFIVQFDLRIGQPIQGGSASECSRFVAPRMPKLEKIQFRVDVRFLKEAGICFPRLESSSLPSLQEATVYIDCEDARPGEVDEAEEALMQSAAVHPNRPSLDVSRDCSEWYMLTSDQDQPPAFYRCKAVDLTVHVWEEEEKGYNYKDVVRLLRNPHIEKLTVSISCEDATVEEVEGAEETVRAVVDAHHNHPTLQMARCGLDKMK